MKRIAIIIGSIRANSFSLQTAKALVAAAPTDSRLEFEFIDIARLPLYNQDYDKASPEAYTTFRNEVAGFDAVLFVTPEHNRTFPAALKNALDVGSRPWGKSIWKGKPAAVASISVGALGGYGANNNLKYVLNYLDMPVMGQPELYLGNVTTVFDENGTLKDPALAGLFSSFMTTFAEWVETLAKKVQ